MSAGGYANFNLAQQARDRIVNAQLQNPGMTTVMDPGPGMNAFFQALKNKSDEAAAQGKSFTVNPAGFGQQPAGGSMGVPSYLSPQGVVYSNDLNKALSDDTTNFNLAQSARALAAAQARAAQDANLARDDQQAQAGRDVTALDSAMTQPRPIAQQPDGSYATGAAPAAPTRAQILAALPGHLQPAVAQMFAQQDTAKLANDQTQAKIGLENAEAAKASGTTGAAGFVPTIKPGLSGDAALNSLAPNRRALVSALVAGRMKLPEGTALKDPNIQSLVADANMVDPDFDAGNYNARFKARQDLTSPSGKGSQTIGAINTAIAHMGKLSDLVDALHNSNIPLVNAGKNFVSKQVGNTAVTNFNIAAPQAMKEVEKIWRGNGGSEADIKQLEDSLSANAGHQQQTEGLNTFLDLLKGKADSLTQQRDTALGKAGADIPVVYKENEPTIQKIRQRAGDVAAVTAPAAAPSGGISVTAPDNSVHQFASQAQADRFKKLAGIK